METTALEILSQIPLVAVIITVVVILATLQEKRERQIKADALEREKQLQEWISVEEGKRQVFQKEREEAWQNFIGNINSTIADTQTEMLRLLQEHDRYVRGVVRNRKVTR